MYVFFCFVLHVCLSSLCVHHVENMQLPMGVHEMKLSLVRSFSFMLNFRLSLARWLETFERMVHLITAGVFEHVSVSRNELSHDELELQINSFERRP